MSWRKVLWWKHSPRYEPGSVVVITGASSGIGEQIAYQYAARDVRLVLAARSKEALDAVAERCRAMAATGRTVEVLTVQTDVTVERHCMNLMAAAVERFGRIDILVLNAGVGCHSSFEATQDLSVYRRVMDVNFFGYLFCARYAMPFLRKAGGMIVVVSSMSGEVGLPFRTAYCASKFAVTGLFEALRIELSMRQPEGGKDVFICMCCPPSVATGLRQHALAPSDHSSKDVPTDREAADGAMTAQECAQRIVDASDRRLRKVYFPVSAYLAVYARPLIPDVVDYFLRIKASL